MITLDDSLRSRIDLIDYLLGHDPLVLLPQCDLLLFLTPLLSLELQGQLLMRLVGAVTLGDIQHARVGHEVDINVRFPIPEDLFLGSGLQDKPLGVLVAVLVLLHIRGEWDEHRVVTLEHLGLIEKVLLQKFLPKLLRRLLQRY